MKNKMVQITLKSVLVIENGTAEEKVEGVNALSVTLVAPNVTKASVTTVRSIKLADNVEKSMENEPFEEKLFFKELILGDCILKAELTAIEKVSKLERFFLKSFPSALGVAVEAIPGVGSIISSVVGAITRSIFDGGDKTEKILVIGRGWMPLGATNDDGDLAINLQVPKTLVLNSRPFLDADGNQAIKKITMQEGFVNARIIFKVEDITPPSGLQLLV